MNEGKDIVYGLMGTAIPIFICIYVFGRNR
nr:MAG TPA: hypothetical protein [Caudoviricetes sp.]